MNQLTYSELYDQKLAEGAILHTHIPFLQDYLTLHILLRKYNPRSVFEVGTHIGEGTKIICNAVPKAKVFSLDLPFEEADKSLQHPHYKDMFIGQKCTRSYTQLLGDSMTFDYSKNPCEAYFIDGEHTKKNVQHETTEILNCKPKLIIYHDADMPEVYKAIIDSIGSNKDYELFRVLSTRIAYAVKK